MSSKCQAHSLHEFRREQPQIVRIHLYGWSEQGNQVNWAGKFDVVFNNMSINEVRSLSRILEGVGYEEDRRQGRPLREQVFQHVTDARQLLLYCSSINGDRTRSFLLENGNTSLQHCWNAAFSTWVGPHQSPLHGWTPYCSTDQY